MHEIGSSVAYAVMNIHTKFSLDKVGILDIKKVFYYEPSVKTIYDVKGKGSNFYLQALGSTISVSWLT